MMTVMDATVLAENFPADTSSIFRGESANDLSPVTSGAMMAGDVLTVNNSCNYSG